MSRLKRTSTHLKEAQIRISSLKSIDTELHLTDELNLAQYQAHVNDLQAQLSTYNAKLSELDALLNNIQATEKALRVYSSRMLTAVAAHYGRNSNAYEQAGGKRTSEIVRRRRTPKN